MAFTVPDNYEPRETRFWIDESGQKWRSLGNICWFTNLDIEKRHESLILYKSYSPEEYPHYDNYNAIEVSKVTDIPCDYEGIMGVPITFLDKYSPDQFEIIMLANGNARTNTEQSVLNEVNYHHHQDDKGGLGVISGKRVYARVLIKKRG